MPRASRATSSERSHHSSTNPHSSVSTTLPSRSMSSRRIGIATGWSEENRTTPFSTTSSKEWPSTFGQANACDPRARILDRAAGSEPGWPPVPAEVRPRTATARDRAASPRYAVGDPPTLLVERGLDGPAPVLVAPRASVGVAGHVPHLPGRDVPVLDEPHGLGLHAARLRAGWMPGRAEPAEPVLDGVLRGVRHAA